VWENFAKLLSDERTAIGGGVSDDVMTTGAFGGREMQLPMTMANAQQTIRGLRTVLRVIPSETYGRSWLGGAGYAPTSGVWQ
jgi:hypothetical protein